MIAKIVTFLLAAGLVLGVLALSGCSTPVYVDRKVEIPVKCSVKPLILQPLALPSLPDNASVPEILGALYHDQVLMAGELRAMQTEMRACE